MILFLLYAYFSKWLAVNSTHMVKAKQSGKSEEFVQDIIDERKKLIQRVQIIDKLHDDQAAIKVGDYCLSLVKMMKITLMPCEKSTYFC